MKFVLLLLVILTVAVHGAERAAVKLTDTRVVGGESTTIDKYPFQVSFVYASSHRCGGAIISEYHVVTTAQCVDRLSTDQISYMKIRAGSSYRTSGGILHDISSFALHPSFNSMTWDYDVAVIKVTDPFIFNAVLQPIEIPTSDYKIEDGLLVTLTGYGTLSFSGNYATQLQVANVPIVNNTQCAVYYAAIKDITDRMVCAGYADGGKHACQGDHGGPLSYGNTLLGLVSWGFGCVEAYDLYPDVYTSVPQVRDWLSEETGIIF